MFILKSLSIIFTSNIKGIPTDFLIKSKEISDRLDDDDQDNREEAVRCLGSLIHYIAEMEQVKP